MSKYTAACPAAPPYNFFLNGHSCHEMVNIFLNFAISRDRHGFVNFNGFLTDRHSRPVIDQSQTLHIYAYSV